VDETTFHHLYLKHSDSGETAFELFAGQANQPVMEIEEINGQFQKIQAARGAAGKLPLLIQLFQKCAALEIKYLVKIITGDLRIGLKEGLVEEAIAAAFDQPAEAVRQAHLLLGDLGETARRAEAGQLHGIGIAPFRPVKFMLASPEESPATIWERLRGDAGKNSEAVWLEDKYDGIRCQLHKADGRIGLYSRDLKDITATFFDVREAARQIPGDLILDGEILAMRGEEVLPFAQLQKRLGRRTDDLFMAGEVPIQFVAFDLLWRDGESFLNQPLRQRREKLAALSLPAGFRLAQISRAHSIDEIAEAFTRARVRNNEGLMIKDPESFYTPGRRGLAWLKLKKAYATLDCVVVGAEYGHGKRKGVLSDYTFAVRDEASGELKTIGKAYSGLTDVEIAELTQHFLSRVLRQRGRYHEVTPDTVLEIAFDRIQESDRHTSGMALRFPRILRIRADKSPAEIDTVAGARRLVQGANDITGEIPGKKSPRKESGRSA
jgi:DNA ligase-1